MNGKQNEAHEALKAQRGLWIVDCGQWIGLKLKLAIIPVSINTAPRATLATLFTFAIKPTCCGSLRNHISPGPGTGAGEVRLEMEMDSKRCQFNLFVSLAQG